MTFTHVNSLLDRVNLRILKELQLDPRSPTAKIARSVEMSAPAVAERIHRLKEAGIITGYRVDVDPKALGLPVAAFVRVRPAPGQLAKVAELAQRTPEVVECHRITGEDCFLLKLYVAEVNQMETVLDRFLVYGQTTTSIVQSSPVLPRALPLPGMSSGLAAVKTGGVELARAPRGPIKATR
jgi:Lrp/AsnC family leucine-responsive transcriptional regulator